ncbi:MAG: prealbumin-like fold domain-containing protein, partial [Candidatus Eremiobacterota bacterium]
LTTSRWSPVNLAAGPNDHRLWSLEVDPALKGRLSLAAGAGLDDGSFRVPVRFRDRRAYQWRAHYQGPWFFVSAARQATGRAYGPNLEQNYRRGEDFLTADLTAQLSPNLDLTESYQRLLFETPVEQPLQRLENVTWLHQLSWRPFESLRLAAQVQATQAGTGGLLTRQDLARLDAFWRMDEDWELIGRFQRRELAGQVSQQTGLSVTHLPGQGHRITLGYDRLTGQTTGFGDQIVLDYQFLPDEDLSFWLNYSLLNQALVSLDRTTLTPIRSRSLSLGTRWHPSARWTLGANGSLSSGFVPGSTLQYQLELGYLFDEHQELVLRYNRSPFLSQILGPNPPADPGRAVTLELRQSWGGPLQSANHARLQPRLYVNVEARPGGRPDEGFRPVAEAAVRLGDREPGRVGPDGTAEFTGLEAGSYAVKLEELGPNYEVQAGPPETLVLEEGDRREVAYRLIAWSSVYAVVFNDVDQDGELPVGYVPFQPVGVRLVGTPFELQTDEQGVARFARLPAGEYTLELVDETVDPSVVPTTPTRFQVKLEPGQEQVVAVGLRAFGRLRARVSLRGARGVEPAAGIPLILREREVGRTESDGSLDLELPAGRLELELRIPPDMYVEDPGGLRLELKPGQTAERQVVVSRYATVELRLSQPLEGVPVETEDGQFLYSDEEGRVTFDRLKAGTHHFVVGELPEGYVLAGPTRITARVASGEVRQIQVPVRRK